VNIPGLIGTADRRGNGKRSARAERSFHDHGHGLVSEEVFLRILGMERKRAERSRKPFLLMLLRTEKGIDRDLEQNFLAGIGSAIPSSIRETDVCGWYKEQSAIGVILTEIGDADRNSIHAIMTARVQTSVCGRLDKELINKIKISLHSFPEDWDDRTSGHSANAALYPDLRESDRSKRFPRILKRAMDIVGSAAALLVLSPLFLGAALAIKLTSKGPVFFRQKRVGQFGAVFTFVKFRSMYMQNDSSAHKEFVTRFIAGKAASAPSAKKPPAIYKITQDPRITVVGKFLRRSSIDELPQLWNVLRGEMSLVGPRPPLPYELAVYDLWHRRRILEVKPGITGLWQVHGRSRTTFDEMVRLDLRYAKEWSLWLDIKILLKTPKAVFSCDGAY
jgi:lipopolysaccharide/colanic/teichoic acid biosynthesis glycosyltransferase